jgi:hypothetical protein
VGLFDPVSPEYVDMYTAILSELSASSTVPGEITWSSDNTSILVDERLAIKVARTTLAAYSPPSDMKALVT